MRSSYASTRVRYRSAVSRASTGWPMCCHMLHLLGTSRVIEMAEWQTELVTGRAITHFHPVSQSTDRSFSALVAVWHCTRTAYRSQSTVDHRHHQHRGHSLVPGHLNGPHHEWRKVAFCGLSTSRNGNSYANNRMLNFRANSAESIVECRRRWWWMVMVARCNQFGNCSVRTPRTMKL